MFLFSTDIIDTFAKDVTHLTCIFKLCFNKMLHLVDPWRLMYIWALLVFHFVFIYLTIILADRLSMQIPHVLLVKVYS